MHSSFYQIPLRDMFVCRVMWNMPKINPQDYKQAIPDQTLPESPQIPPLTPPTTPATAPHRQRQIAYPKRRKRPCIDPKVEVCEQQHGVASHTDKYKEERSKWVPVPESSSKERLKEIKYLLEDPNVCRFCGDTFCRDPTWGDPYLISCAKCDAKYHSFCIENKTHGWRCYKCQHAPRPGLASRSDDNLSAQCQFCHRQSPDVGGRLVEYGGLGDNSLNRVHENCAYYSKGVIKQADQWFGLHTAVRESNFTKCSFCHKKGASIPCEFPKCRKLFHYPCAKHNECFMVQPSSQHLFYMETVLKNPDIHNSSKVHPFQVPPTSPESVVIVPQSNKKKLRKTKRKKTSVPDGDEDNNLSCQVL